MSENSAQTRAEDLCKEREAQFLASQKARVSKFSNNNAEGDDFNLQKERKEFWIIFKKSCSDMHDILSELDMTTKDGSTKTAVNMYITAQQRNAALEKMLETQRTIRAIHHFTLHSKKLTTEMEKLLPDAFVGLSMPELPMSDTRLLNVEMQSLLDKVKQVQDVIIPKEKFRFKRYRAYLQEQKEVDFIETDDILMPIEINEGEGLIKDESTPFNITFDGIKLEKKSNCNIKVEPNGELVCTDLNHSNGEFDDSKCEDIEDKAFLVKDVDTCNVALTGTYNSVHIVDTRDSIIRLKNPIEGPIHVTNCHKTKIYIPFSRQLRIHDCTDVSFFIHVASGPIIEGCKGMQFHEKTCLGKYSKETNLYRDVKDFNWLKNLVKSPNFDVFSEEESQKRTELIAESIRKTRIEEEVQKMSIASSPSIIRNEEESPGEDTSDDEDEL